MNVSVVELREFALSPEEYEQAIRLLGREPNRLELGIIGAMWSEHCGYKNSRPLLGTFPTSGPKVVQGPGENAGAVALRGGLTAVFKVESHNHPSAIEPYQGAATGVGGIVRDIFTMGARPVAILDSLRFGNPSDPRTSRLLSGVVRGIGDYGNSLGIPTVGGETGFSQSYNGNPLVNAMCVGIAPVDGIIKGEAGEPGNVVLLVGTDTGRDGIHGATFASVDDPHESHRGVIQVGNPFMEKLLMEACLELVGSPHVVGMQDCGAAGLTSSSVECAGRTGSGIEIDVSKVSRRETGLTAYEVMLSESQERMLLVVRPEGVDEVRAVFEKWDLHSDIIGVVTGDGLLRVRDGDETVCELSIALLTDEVPRYRRDVIVSERILRLRDVDVAEIAASVTLSPLDALKKLLGSPNISDKRWIWQQYDHTIGTSTIHGPASADAAVMRVRPTGEGLALTMDCNSRYCMLDPYQGGAGAVVEAARNLACVGAEPLGLTNCLNFGNPEKPEGYWQLAECVRGMADACRTLGIPVVSGNVSLYNESEGISIYPTPIVGMVGTVPGVEQAAGSAFEEGLEIYLLSAGQPPSLAASEWLSIVAGRDVGKPPAADLDGAVRLYDFVRRLVRSGEVVACHDLAEGGLAVALAESCLQRHIGLDAREIYADLDGIALHEALFGEAHGRVLVGMRPGNGTALIERAHAAGIEAIKVGVATGTRFALGPLLDAELEELRVAYTSGLLEAI